MGKSVLLSERSGNWLFLSDTQTLAKASPKPLLGHEGIQLWQVSHNSNEKELLAAIRFPAGWQTGLCWSWAIRHLEGESGQLIVPASNKIRTENHALPGKEFEWLNLGGEGSALVAHTGCLSELVVLRFAWPRDEENRPGKWKRPGTQGPAACADLSEKSHRLRFSKITVLFLLPLTLALID